MGETYRVNFNCGNCKRVVILEFQKGEPASLTGPCPYCGVSGGGYPTEQQPPPHGKKEILLEKSERDFKI